MAPLALTRRTFLATGAALAVPAQARPGEALYTATAIVTGYDMRSRPAGFAQCLTEVLVKITGDPSLATDPRATAAAGVADTYVKGFTYFDPIAHRRPHDDQGSYDRSYDLTVTFEPAKVDALVAQLGRGLWTGKRPTLVPLIRMVGTTPPWVGDFVVTESEPRAAPQRASLANAATRYGIPLRVPASPDVAEAEGEMVIPGALRFTPADFGWTGSWHTHWRGAEHTASMKGVSFDTAFERLVGGAVRIAAGTGPFG